MFEASSRTIFKKSISCKVPKSSFKNNSDILDLSKVSKKFEIIGKNGLFSSKQYCEISKGLIMENKDNTPPMQIFLVCQSFRLPVDHFG